MRNPSWPEFWTLFCTSDPGQTIPKSCLLRKRAMAEGLRGGISEVLQSVIYKCCLHCNKELSIKRFKEHQRLYYNHDTKEWLKTEQDGIDHTDSEDESDFSYIDSDSSFKDSNNNCDLEDWVTEDSEEEDSNVEEMEQQSRHDEEHPMYSMPSSELTKGKHTY